MKCWKVATFLGCMALAFGACDKKEKTLTLDLGGGVRMELVLIPAGEFMIGSRDSFAEVKRKANGKSDWYMKDWYKDEHLRHRVRITRAFYIGKYEVTQSQYERVMGKNPSYFKGGDLPVEQVTWNDATEFCRKLSQRTGKTVRLSTEAEWEYACRAGTTAPFHFGETISTNQVNYNGNYPYAGGAKGTHRGKTTSVGSFPANAWGLHDMHGNVCEWCSDWYDKGYYGKSPGQDPKGPTSGSDRVLRGGDWYHRGGICRSANRSHGDPSGRDPGHGFRVVVVAAPGSQATRMLAETKKRLGPAKTMTLDLGGGVRMELVLIPAGEFMMGSSDCAAEVARKSRYRGAKAEWFTREHPRHRVRITQPFYMGKYEVTQAQYERIMGKNPSKSEGSDLPVEQVSWNDATEFCRKLSQRTGKKMRLPTEAEWEYACRAGSTRAFHFGGSLSSRQANFDGAHPYGTAAKGVYRKKTTSVASFPANAWGLHDMHGNLWEWCSDWYDKGYYAKSPGQDPSGPTSGSSRVARGGSWHNNGWLCRSAFRAWNVPSHRDRSCGFRVAVVVVPGQ